MEWEVLIHMDHMDHMDQVDQGFKDKDKMETPPMPPLAMLGPREQAQFSFGDVEGATSLELLQSVYRSAALPLPTRMRAAIAALPFETPKLAVTAIGPMSEGFAMQLEKAIARSGKLIEAQAIKTVEAAPEPASEPTVAKGRLRRF